MRFSAIFLAPLVAVFAAAANVPRLPGLQLVRGRTPITVWLLNYAPTTANLNATGQFTDATVYYGAFLIGNFGLPPIGNPVPPTTLTMPDVSGFAVGSEMYIAVVETANNCPPGNQPLQYGLTSALLVTA
ncbi:hypothetical protein DFH09DRAFT_1143707 [Mycena vulgaris]|nr:hypothetical protein DFH09DRAFT_1143707 [Mycena vulgaris]